MAIDYRQFAILFVDDEEMACKYFRKGLSREFDVLTASSVDDALQILAAESPRIGVLVSDQRMPGRQGVDLLREARADYPSIVRILTTAYSDLGDAIEAVNNGQIFRYITKPWDFHALSAEMRQAMEFYLLRRERDQLLAEKLSVGQRQIQTMRIRYLMLLAACRRELDNAMSGVQGFLTQLRLTEEKGPQPPVRQNLQLGHWQQDISETKRMLALAELINGLVEEASGSSNPVDLPPLLEQAGRQYGVTIGAEPGLPPLQADAGLLGAACRALASDCAALNSNTAELSVQRTGAGVRIGFSFSGWPPAGSLITSPADTDVNAPLHASLLAAALAAGHQGGRLTMERDGNKVAVAMELPTERSSLPAPEADWLDQLLIGFEDFED